MSTLNVNLEDTIMDTTISEYCGPYLALSSLRLLLSPLRLVSAAIWQTIEQKVVSDYGLLEEFVSVVTDIVPELLLATPKTELMFALRARLILELCRSEETAALHIIQPHLDRIQTLQSLWDVESEPVNLEMSNSDFLDLVHGLLSDPEERDNFFKDEFSHTYDKVIKKVMWLFLSRLEKLTPVQSFQQVASLLGDASCVLSECIESVSQPHDLRDLLGYQKDLIKLEEYESYNYDSGILSALCLPLMDRDEQMGVHPMCTEMEQEEKYIHMDGTTHSGEDVESTDVKPEDSAVLVTELEKDMPSEASGVSSKMHKNIKKGTEAIYGGNWDLTKMDCAVVLERLDISALLSSSPVRRNRGLKMKMYLLQRRKRRNLGGGSKGSEHYIPAQDSTKINQVQRRHHVSKMVSHIPSVQRSTKKTHFCSVCERRYATSWYFKHHRCRNKGVQRQSKQRHLSKRQESSADTRLTAGEGEGLPVESGRDLPSESISQEDPDYSPPAQNVPCKKSRQKRIICDTTWTQGPNATLTTGAFVCLHCSVTFQCPQTFRSHLRNIGYHKKEVVSEHVEPCLKCDECDNSFNCQMAFESHKLTHDPLYCDVCMQLVRDSIALEMHKVSHTPYQCNQCEEKFPLFKGLYKHYVDKHSSVWPLPNSYCQFEVVDQTLQEINQFATVSKPFRSPEEAPN